MRNLNHSPSKPSSPIPTISQKLGALGLKWTELKGQERQWLLGLAWVLGLAFFWGLVWRPCAYLSSTQMASEHLVFSQLQELKSQASQAHELLVKPQLSASDSRSALNKITQSLLPQAQISTNANQVTVTLAMAQAADLANWIKRIREDAQCQIREATLNRAISNSNGVFWSARFVIGLPNPS